VVEVNSNQIVVSVCYSGADELLTVLSYVVIQTQHPDLIIESSAVMDFAREKFVFLVVLN